MHLFGSLLIKGKCSQISAHKSRACSHCKVGESETNRAHVIMLSPCHPCPCPGQRICRRGTERPCYKVSYIQDSRRRLTFEDAMQACRSEGGELLSIETESEQRLIEKFIKKLPDSDGDFWIGLRRSTRHPSPGCPSQYYWLDGSKAKFRSSFF